MINLKPILKIQGILTTVGSLFFLWKNLNQFIAFLAGATLITFNFFLLAQLWMGILSKKPIAITIAVVVFKYAILGIVLYIFVRKLELPLGALCLGISSLGISFLISSFYAF